MPRVFEMSGHPTVGTAVTFVMEARLQVRTLHESIKTIYGGGRLGNLRRSAAGGGLALSIGACGIEQERSKTAHRHRPKGQYVHNVQWETNQ
jgi:hypothetical protein